MTRVLVFGTFDGLHEGHKAYLAQAREFGDTIIASVPSDSTVKLLKGKTPTHTFEERKQALLASKLVQEVVLSDPEQGSYKILERVYPDRILLGYDQEGLKKDLEKILAERGLPLPVYQAESLHPHIYKSHLLNS